MRIGDFIVGISLMENKLVCFLCFNQLKTIQNSTRIQKQKVLALYSYSLAYEWAHQGWEEGFCDSHQLDPLLALCFAELHVLLQNNLRNKTDRMSQALQNCNKQSVIFFLFFPFHQFCSFIISLRLLRKLTCQPERRSAETHSSKMTKSSRVAISTTSTFRNSSPLRGSFARMSIFSAALFGLCAIRLPLKRAIVC